MRYVQVRLEDGEYEKLDQVVRFRGFRSMQEVARKAIVEFVTAPEQQPDDKFMDLAARFYVTAPEQIRQLIEDNMRRFVDVENKSAPKRREKTG